MRIKIYHPGRCQDCGKLVPLNGVKYGRRIIPCESGIGTAHQIFSICPFCGMEIYNHVGPVDKNGAPIIQEEWKKIEQPERCIYIRAAHRLFTSSLSFTESEMAKAEEDNAPQTAVYRKLDGTWVTIEKIQDGTSKERFKLL